MGECLYLVFENPRNHRRLIVHLAHDITESKKNEGLLHKMIDVSRQLSNIQEVALKPMPITPLSEQEIEILRLFSTGKNAAEIARRLKITLQTLRNHLHHINQKLHTHNRLEAVTHAMQRKLLSRFESLRSSFLSYHYLRCLAPSPGAIAPPANSERTIVVELT